MDVENWWAAAFEPQRRRDTEIKSRRDAGATVESAGEFLGLVAAGDDGEGFGTVVPVVEKDEVGVGERDLFGTT